MNKIDLEKIKKFREKKVGIVATDEEILLYLNKKFKSCHHKKSYFNFLKNDDVQREIKKQKFRTWLCQNDTVSQRIYKIIEQQKLLSNSKSMNSILDQNDIDRKIEELENEILTLLQ